MKTTRFCFALGFTLVAVWFSSPARAQYTYFNSQSGSDVLVQEVRWPYWNSSFYDTWLSQWWQSSEGASGYFYSGLPNPSLGSPNPVTQGVNWSFWPVSNPVNVTDTIIPVYRGPTTYGGPTIGEGTICTAPASFPFWQTNVWYRVAFRTWLPVDGTPHQGYAGQWLRDSTSGIWYHYGTMQLPFAVTGIGGQMGFQEHFTGGAPTNRVDHRNCYYRKNGAWSSASQFICDHGGTNCSVGLIEGNTAVYSEVGTGNGYVANTWLTLTQPAAPAFFDPILVTNYSAAVAGNQLLVQWQIPNTSSPQFAYQLDVFTNSSHTGAVVATFFDIAPEARQKLLALPAGTVPYPRLTIIDVFNQTNPPLFLAVTNAGLSAATPVVGAVNGLNFAYYETATNWSVLPDFTALAPVLQGAVNGLDLTPRRQRSGYGFNYSGYLNVASNGLYAFTLNSCAGSALLVDGQAVVNNDGVHSPEDATGWIGLSAGYHLLNVQYFMGAGGGYYDTLGLSWEGPGQTNVVVPPGAFFRVPGGGEPAISLVSPVNGATVSGANVPLAAAVTTNGNTLGNVQFYVGNNYWAQDAAAPYSLNSFFWASPTNALRARLFYNGSNLLDSAVNWVNTTNMALAPWQFGQVFYHYYPSGASIQGNTYSVIGDGVNLLTRQISGDCTLIAHLAGLPGTAAAPDGSTPNSGWQAGIILRGNTNMVPGYPWGYTNTAPFTAVFGQVGGGAYYQDETMVNGGGGYSSGSLGSQKWFRLQRVGNTFTGSVSADGVNWTVVNTDGLADFGLTIYAGFFTYAGPSSNPNIPWASFDSVSLTGTNVLGAPGVSISPLTNAVIGGLPATFTASVIGPVPAGYQWQLNGTNIPTATNISYTITSVAPADVGSYTVVANSITSAPAILLLTAPAGSGVWTNLNGGSWAVGNNWSGGLIAGGTDAAADFSTLNLSANPIVSLNGSNAVGTLVFDDLNPAARHNWTLTNGSGGPLTLAVSSGTPNLAVKSATNLISAVLAGTQGFTKTGAGCLILSAANPITGTAIVSAGALEVQNKSGDAPYAVAQGATLRIGYSTGGGYAATGLTINGNATADPGGFYLKGGKTYNASGQIALLVAPTTLRQYGSGLASIGTFDIGGNGLWCSSAASGSLLDPNLQLVSSGYGMSVQVDAGANTAAGDLTINGPLNVGSLGFYKRGAGSLVLNGTATSANTAVQLQGGTVICGTPNCLGVNANVPVSSGAKLALNGFDQAVAALNAAAGSTVVFGGTNSLTVTNATLAGALQLAVFKGATPVSSRLVVTGNPLAFGGSLVVTNLSGGSLAAGDTFTLFSASSYSGAFSSLNLPVLPVGMLWDAGNLATNGTLTIVTNGLSLWNGGGSDGYWSTASNWNGTLPVNGQSLTFQGALRLNNTNNLLTSAGQVVFNNGGIAVSGNPLTLLWGLANLAGNNTWAIGTTLSAPQSFVSSNGTLTVSGAVTNAGFNLTLDGAGTNVVSGLISGSGGLLKNGAGVATLSGANVYTGGTTVNGGLVIDGIGSTTAGAFGAFNAAATTITILSGATVDINGKAAGNDFFYGVTLAGSGTSGQGGVVNNGASGTSGNRQLPNLTLAANATLGGSGDIYMVNAGHAADTLNLAGFTLTKTGANKFILDNTAVTGGGTINIVQGTVSTYTAGSAAFGTAFVLANTAGVTLDASVNSLSIGSLAGGGATGGNVTLGAKTLTVGGDNTSPSPFAGVISGTGGVLVKTGAGTLMLGGTNTYTGTTTVNGGALLVNGTLAAGSAVTVAAGGALGGTGNVKGAVTVQAGGVFAPGNGGIGTLTISNNLVLAGLAVMEVSRNGGVPTNDVGIISGALTQGGSLVVTNIGTNALVAGDSFKLFNAGTFSSGFTNVTLPALSAGLKWGTNSLLVNGTIVVSNLTYTLTYNAGANGAISGASPQTVNYGTNGSAVTAVAATGYHFVSWSDSSVANPRTDANVTSNLTVTANFGINTYTLTYAAGTNGNLTGVTNQTVNYGGSGTAVTANPNPGSAFTNWSDGATANPRVDSGVTNNVNVTANFVAVPPVPPVILPVMGVSGGGFNFQFAGVVGLHYRVESTPVLPAPGPWSLVTDIVSLAASPLAVTVPATNSLGYYRVGLVP